MKTKAPCPYVKSVQDGTIRAVCAEGPGVQVLSSRGAKRSALRPKNWKLYYNSEAELAGHLAALRDAGLALGGAEAGWPPAAIFEELRSKGLVSGGFKEITWTEPDSWKITEK